MAGEIFAMAGVSRRHSLITTNLGAELRNHLRGGPCEVHLEAIQYVLIAQSHAEVTIHRRRVSWAPVVIAAAESAAESAVEFRSIGLSIPLARIYADVPAGPP